MWGIRDGTQAVPDNDKDVIGVAEGVKLSGLLGGLSVFSHSLTVSTASFCAPAPLLCQKGRGSIRRAPGPVLDIHNRGFIRGRGICGDRMVNVVVAAPSHGAISRHLRRDDLLGEDGP